MMLQGNCAMLDVMFLWKIKIFRCS